WPRRARAGTSSRPTRSVVTASPRPRARWGRRRSLAERTQGAASRVVPRRRSAGAPQRVASHLRLVRPARRRTAAETRRLARRDLGLLYAAAGSLTVVGLVMVLSAGSVSAAQGYAGNSFWYFQRQVLYAGVGIGAAWMVADRKS